MRKLFVETHLVELNLVLGFTALYAGIEAKLLQQLASQEMLQLDSKKNSSRLSAFPINPKQ